MTEQPDFQRCKQVGCPSFWHCRRGYLTPNPEALTWLLPEPEDLTPTGCRHYLPDHRLAECEDDSCSLS